MPVTVCGMDYHGLPKSARTSHPNAGHCASSPSRSRLCQPRQCPGEAGPSSASQARLVRPLPTRNVPPPRPPAGPRCFTSAGLSARGSRQFHGSWYHSNLSIRKYLMVNAQEIKSVLKMKTDFSSMFAGCFCLFVSDCGFALVISSRICFI
jgi:hypothetical protein